MPVLPRSPCLGGIGTPLGVLCACSLAASWFAAVFIKNAYICRVEL
nr:MAG TPA: hypothetical protein [Caudoviricetes sp.]